jgi:hypothetical protein
MRLPLENLDATFWAEYQWVPAWNDGVTPHPRWMRTRVLKFVGINNDRFMFTVYPGKLWLLLTSAEVQSRYQQGILRALVIKGGKS